MVIGKKLILTNVLMSDEGRYFCAARSELDDKTHKSVYANLYVTGM